MVVGRSRPRSFCTFRDGRTEQPDSLDRLPVRTTARGAAIALTVEEVERAGAALQGRTAPRPPGSRTGRTDRPRQTHPRRRRPSANGPPQSKHSCCETCAYLAASGVLIRRQSRPVRRSASGSRGCRIRGALLPLRDCQECQRIRCQPPRMPDQRELARGRLDHLLRKFSHVISTGMQPSTLLRRGRAPAARCPRGAARWRLAHPPPRLRGPPGPAGGRRTGRRRGRPGRTSSWHRSRRVGRRGRWPAADPMTCTPRTPAWLRSRPMSWIQHRRRSWARSRCLLAESKGRSNVDVLRHGLPFGRRTAESPRPCKQAAAETACTLELGFAERKLNRERYEAAQGINDLHRDAAVIWVTAQAS